MKTCGDCIHADVCEHNPNIPLFNRANAAYCVSFKDRKKYVEVVRCKNCKHYVDGPYDNGDMMCDYWGEWIFPHDDDFCSNVERKDNA